LLLAGPGSLSREMQAIFVSILFPAKYGARSLDPGCFYNAPQKQDVSKDDH
jgi:hypothetical protein